MYRKKVYVNGSLRLNQSVEGETIETKIERMEANGEPLGANADSAALIYTDKSEGVIAGYDVRTDRFEIAVEAMDKATKSKIAKGEAKRIDIAKGDGDGKPKASQ